MSTTRKSLIALGLVVASVTGGFAGQALAGGQSFSDVPPSHQFYDDIEFMAQTGIAGGFEDGTYRPGQAVTRQAMAAFIHRANDYESVSSANLHTQEAFAEEQVTCPDGTEVVSGFGHTSASTDMFLTSTEVSADGKTLTVRFETDDDQELNFSATAQAICGPVDVEVG
jgi:hypothetical protein